MAAGVEPFATWYYPFAWYATLLILDAAVALRGGRFFFLDRPAFALTLLAWSAPFWLLFELVNLRLANWYYVFVPPARAARWTGIALSFATVLPAILGSERLLGSFELGRGLRWPAIRWTPGRLAAVQLVGAAMIVATLAWPRLLFPLVWGAVTLVADPFVYRRAPTRSLLGDLEQGRPGRIVRLLVGGLVIGLVWEVFNIGARGKWIYTVPGLEEWKLLEMPVPGFLGFPVFALDGFATWQSLVVTGLAVPRRGAARSAPTGARVAAALLAAVFSVVVLLAMERGTISSTSPRLADLPGVPAGALAAAGHDPFSLADADPEVLAREIGVEPGRAAEWIAGARLATLRGLGAENAARLRVAGIESVEELARADPCALVETLRTSSDRRVVPARIRVWVRAARRAEARRARSPP